MNTVLVVDDDKVFSGLLKTIFELEGYRAVIVLRPDEVVPTARRVKPVLVLMDLHLSRGDTLSVLRELRADETLKAVPVLMTSGMDRSGECLAAGADAFILKPFRPAQLLAMVADLVEGQDTDT
ncbi:MAG: response regulator [Chloroflexi bacterium]|nr:MAG: response regulator [Chloroflexota bacterium]RLC92118.1 MAG: response regulator [Chloroflexota bacterium]